MQKKYRYYVDEKPKSSVTTIISKRTRPDLQNWYKQNRYDAIKQIMLEDNQPLNKINDFISRVTEIAEKKESFGREIGSELHDWIDIYFKSEKTPAIPTSQPLKNMVERWLKFLERAKIQGS